MAHPQCYRDVLEPEGRQDGTGAHDAPAQGAGEQVRRPGRVRWVGGVGVVGRRDGPAAGAVRRGPANDPTGVEQLPGAGGAHAAAQPLRKGLCFDEHVVVCLWVAAQGGCDN